jgi:PadR family transcriptional regulator PadR
MEAITRGEQAVARAESAAAVRLLTAACSGAIYGATTYGDTMLTDDLKKGSAEFLVLSLLDAEARHGYELQKLIETRSKGVLVFHVASLYPLLYRLEERGWIAGRWVERAGERRKRYYRLTSAGKAALDEQRDSWREFVSAINGVVRYA